MPSETGASNQTAQFRISPLVFSLNIGFQGYYISLIQTVCLNSSELSLDPVKEQHYFVNHWSFAAFSKTQALKRLKKNHS